jgi:hypothetical protein
LKKFPSAKVGKKPGDNKNRSVPVEAEQLASRFGPGGGLVVSSPPSTKEGRKIESRKGIEWSIKKHVCKSSPGGVV